MTQSFITLCGKISFLKMYSKKSFDGFKLFILIAEHGLGMCNITKYFVDLCPEHIRITNKAIIPMKEQTVDKKNNLVRYLRKKTQKPIIT